MATKPPARRLTPEEQTELNKKTRTQAATQKRVQKVNERLASRLARYGWTVIDPDGVQWVDTGEEEADTKAAWGKY